jgi:hypothetical protein
VIRNPLVPLAVAFLACSAWAQGNDVYTWTDEQGVVHYTNDLQSPPGDTVLDKFKGDDLSVVSIQQDEIRAKPEDARERLEKLDLRRAELETQRAEADARAAQAHAEGYWRSLFRSANDRIRSLEAELERERVAVEEVNGLPVSQQYVSTCGRGTGVRCRDQVLLPSEKFARAKVKIRQLQTDITRARSDLSDLERRASYAAIPREWRR